MKRLLLLWLLLWTGAGWAQDKPTHHVLMVDVSGSMRTRGYATRDGWTAALPDLVKKLFAPDDTFLATDTLVNQPFSDRVTDEKEGRQPYGPFPLQEWAGKAAGMPAPGGGATDMDRALDIANEQVQKAGDRALVWLITDNEDHAGTNQDDQKFYARLRDSQDFSHVVLFPLADPEKRPNDNLVMYLLVPKGQWESPQIDALVQDVQKKTSFEGIVFRPLYSDPGAAPLDFSKELTVEGVKKHKVAQEGGATVLYFREGDKLQGNLRFKVRSRMRGWKLVGARLEDAQVELDIPSTYKHAGKGKVSWQVTPKALEVEPQKDSVDFFLLQLRGPDDKPMELSRSTGARLADPFARYLPEIKGKVKMAATLDVQGDQIKPHLTEDQRKRLQAVPNLGEIERYMAMQEDSSGSSGNQRVIEWQRNVIIRVEADSLPAFLMMLAFALLGLLLLALLIAALLLKRHYELDGPGIHEEIEVSYLAGRYLIVDGKGVPMCSLRVRLGTPSLVAEPDMQFAGGLSLLPVTWEGDEFRFEIGPEGKGSEVFRLLRRSGGSSAGSGDGGAVL